MGDEYDGLTSEEIVQLEFGSPSDQIRYASAIIEQQNEGVHNRSSIYKAVGSCIKKYGFRSVAMSSRHTTELTDDSVFPRLVYMCKSYSEAFESKKSGKLISVEDILVARDEVSKVADKRKKLTDPKAALLELFCSGKVGFVEYEEAKDSVELSEAIVRKVLGYDSQE